MRSKLLLVFLSMFMVVNVYSQLTPALTPVTPSKPSTQMNSSNPSALFFKSVLLRDGDSICLTTQYPSVEYCSQEMKIINKYRSQIMSAGILKSFDIQKHENELSGLMNEDAYGLYDGYPSYYRLYGLFYSRYFRNLIKVKAVREYGFQVLGDMVVDYCSYFPKDFKTKVVTELKSVQKTIKTCKKHLYSCVEDKYGTHLSVDGRINDDIAFTLEGMIARRICMDNIPISELEEFVLSLLKRLDKVNTDSNPDVLYKVTINNELSYCLGIEGPYFISEKNKKRTIPYVDEDLLISTYYGQKVFCNNGADGRFYKICNQKCYRGEWGPLPKYYEDTREIILNAEGKLLYRK